MPNRTVRKVEKKMTRMNWNRLGFFVLGTFTGGWVLGGIARVLGR